ncbi:MAG TPA: hypothetical protein VLL04_14310, partial [Rhizomicrobium sp.]|nr:hypothetical protein [Rhizomicrobium sp.]
MTDGWGIAASHNSFVAWIRRCDESAAVNLLGSYCVAQVPEEAAERRKSGQCDRFFQDFCGVLSGMIIHWILQTRSGSGILLQRGIAILDREAAALPGRFLPELGRSSERPFFLRRSFGPWRRCSSLM